jgi:hypothetical protein
MPKKYKVLAFIYSFIILAFITNIGTTIEAPKNITAGEHVIMPGMTKDKVVSITGIHSGMEKAIVSSSKGISETWYLYFEPTEKKWLVEKCNNCEYWEITFTEKKVKSVRVLTKSQ